MLASQNNDITLNSEDNGGGDNIGLLPDAPAQAQGSVGYEWHLDSIHLDQTIWDEFDGTGVHVGIYDYGVDTRHPELWANYDASREVKINGVTYSGAPNGADQNHGTAVAGLIGASDGNGGTTGVAPNSSLTSVNIFDTTSGIYVNSVDRTAFLQAVHQMANFDITNNSWGAAPKFGDGQNVNISSSHRRAVINEYDYSVDNGRHGLGTVIVQSAGNDNLDANGDEPQCVAVHGHGRGGRARWLRVVLFQLRCIDPGDGAWRRHSRRPRDHRPARLRWLQHVRGRRRQLHKPLPAPRRRRRS